MGGDSSSTTLSCPSGQPDWAVVGRGAGELGVSMTGADEEGAKTEGAGDVGIGTICWVGTSSVTGRGNGIAGREMAVKAVASAVATALLPVATVLACATASTALSCVSCRPARQHEGMTAVAVGLHRRSLLPDVLPVAAKAAVRTSRRLSGRMVVLQGSKAVGQK